VKNAAKSRKTEGIQMSFQAAQKLLSSRTLRKLHWRPEK